MVDFYGFHVRYIQSSHGWYGYPESHLLPMCFCISLVTKGHFELIEVLGGKCHFKKLPGDEKTTHPIVR